MFPGIRPEKIVVVAVPKEVVVDDANTVDVVVLAKVVDVEVCIGREVVVVVVYVEPVVYSYAPMSQREPLGLVTPFLSRLLISVDKSVPASIKDELLFRDRS